MNNILHKLILKVQMSDIKHYLSFNYDEILKLDFYKIK